MSESITANIDCKWVDVWGICYGGMFTHAKYYSEAEAVNELSRLKSKYENCTAEIIHLENAECGHFVAKGFGPFKEFTGTLRHDA